jgi:uncharacterized integral membrane protein
VIVAAWVSAIAILSVQNAAPVALKFLIFQSIQMPVGVVLAFSVCIGVIGMAVIQMLWGVANWQSSSSTSPETAEDYFEYE